MLSANSHLEIASDRWTNRVPAEYRDWAPRRSSWPTAVTADREKIYKGHFEAAFPEITVVYAALGSVGTRIMTERRAERFIPDVYLGAPGSDTLPGMIEGGVYQPVRELGFQWMFLIRCRCVKATRSRQVGMLSIF